MILRNIVYYSVFYVFIISGIKEHLFEINDKLHMTKTQEIVFNTLLHRPLSQKLVCKRNVLRSEVLKSFL